MRTNVVIVGGGFGGLRAARALKSAPVDVTLIDRRNYHLFQPLLYQVATGSLGPGEIAAPLRSVFSRQEAKREAQEALGRSFREGTVVNKPRISVIDDDGAVRRAVSNLLASADFQADLFASAEEFLRSGLVPGTGCLILDVKMPGMSGVELQEQLIASATHVPIIFITAHADAVTRARVLERGAVDFLPKPFSDEAMLDAVARAVRRRDPDGMT